MEIEILAWRDPWNVECFILPGMYLYFRSKRSVLSHKNACCPSVGELGSTWAFVVVSSRYLVDSNQVS